jgi:hypothetical protein
MLLIWMAYVMVFVLVYERVIVPVWAYDGFHSNTTLATRVLYGFLAALPSL